MMHPRKSAKVCRAGVIQTFEFTYELCWKFMKRWLAENISPMAVDGIPRKELFRLAAESRLIADFNAWNDHHRARTLTSHTYDQRTAEIYLSSRSISRGCS